MIPNLVLNAVFTLMDKYVISKITYSPLREYFESLVAPLKKVAILLIDSNPNNNEQLKEFWESNKATLINLNIDTAIFIIEREVKDEILRDVIITLLEVARQQEKAVKVTSAKEGSTSIA